ncbi:spore coat protein [Oxalobacteraceae bacterium OM1]|nr:spore coat protein [Oxalobacteraceae bacterium OM1]
MILAILQARTSSSRLPGKVLKSIVGQPMLARQLERVRRSARLDRIVVATSTDPSDDTIATLCADLGVDCSRGSLNDVLDRFYQTALPYRPQHVVRLTGDCPLADPILIDEVIDFYRDGKYDHVSNAGDPPTFPDGLDVEVFPFTALEAAWHEATLPSEREHVTPFIYNHPERFKLGQYRNETDLSALRWTVDEPADFELVSKLYEALYPADPAFTTQDVLRLLEQRPEYKTLNTQFRRNEGYAKSVLADAAFIQLQQGE